MISLQVPSDLAYRDVTLRVAAAACRLVADGDSTFRIAIVSAVSEAFNNIVLHSYKGLPHGVVDLQVTLEGQGLCFLLKDYGESFDISTIPQPELDLLPERGLGLYIMRAFASVSYSPGPPNVITLRRTK